MFLEILIGVLAAVFLLVVVSLLLSALVQSYEDLLRRVPSSLVARRDLIPVLARFAAAATLALLAALLLLTAW